jgi:hypothetical protein
MKNPFPHADFGFQAWGLAGEIQVQSQKLKGAKAAPKS